MLRWTREHILKNKIISSDFFYFNMQIVGGSATRYRHANDTSVLDSTKVEDNWFDLETDLYHWTKSVRPVQVCYSCLTS